MKTLVNKQNPQIRITAPEIDDAAVYGVNCRTLHSTQLYLFREDWTLVEEEPVQEEICSKCVYHKKDDGYCYYPHGGMKRRINENGVCECTEFCEKEQEQPEVDLEKTVEFECIGKKVKMTVQELINYYIDSECADVADECGF